jgi:hypothetical protein
MTDPKKPRLYDKSFEYTRAAETDIRVLFNRIRAQQQTKQTRMHPVKEKSRA